MELTYKQTIKEKSRKILWEHSINSLTYNRVANRVLNPLYMRKLWHYCYDECLVPYYAPRTPNFDIQYFNDWLSFSEITYGSKKPEELKVAFFCGPEPENDLKHLLDMGVRIENVYAFEYDKNLFNIAVGSLQDAYPQLKIFRGKIDDFTESAKVVFDIIYLDFTKSLLQEFKTVCKLLEDDVLAEQSVIIVNTTYPDPTKENVQFLTDYFFNQADFEYSALYGQTKDYQGVLESCWAMGLDEDDVSQLIEKNFEDAYSAFQTHFLNSYAAQLKPVISVMNSLMLKERLFSKPIKDLKRMAVNYMNTEDVRFHPDEWAWGLFTMNGLLPKWTQFFDVPEKGMTLSRGDCIRIKELYMNSTYEKVTDILSKSLSDEIDKITKSLIDPKGGLFCDVPLPHLWLEMLINQLGYPYHQNTRNLKRYKYKAKERTMCLDILTFDRCRSLYDWLPMIEYYGDGLSVLERQMITRMCIDAINKHTIWVLNRQYYGSAMVGVNEYRWAANHELMPREEIKG